MKLRLMEHLLSTSLVALLLVGVMFMTRDQAVKEAQVPADIAPYVQWDFSDLNDPFEKALFLDLLDNYYPSDKEKNAQIVERLESYRHDELIISLQGSEVKETLTGKKFLSLLWMYIKFLWVYVVVMGLTYYGVQTLAVWRFVREKRSQGADSLAEGKKLSGLPLKILKKLLGALGSMVLFSPAYIIAYSIRTEFNMDIPLFVILLAAISNGLLATYSTKFYTFLTAESRKGYVETAVVKNLDNSYRADNERGIRTGAIFRVRKQFDSHVFGHIFKNAEFQYLATIKEQAAFLITGLVIIEMALNIHGHLSYEMLKQLLYKNYDIVITILLMIFLTVKLTEVFTDILIHFRHKKFSNQVYTKQRSSS